MRHRPALQHGKKRSGRLTAHRLRHRLNGRQRHVEQSVNLDAVKADHRQILRNPQVQQPRRLLHRDGKQIVGGEDLGQIAVRAQRLGELFRLARIAFAEFDENRIRQTLHPAFG